jgi:acetyl esterase/lipase
MKGVMNRWVDEFAWFADSQHIGFISGLEGEAPYAEVAVDIHQRDFNGFRTRTDLLGEFSDLRLLPNGAIVATRMMVNRPPEIVMVAAPVDRSNKSFADAALSVVTHLNDGAVDSLDLSPQESYWFTGAEGAKVQGFILRPPNFNPSRKYPVKLLIHGGPQGAWGDAWSYRWNAELMAASGYVVVMVNPRGSTGYGQAFIDGVNGDWGGKAYVDLMKGLDYAEQHYSFIDKTRECALGASYGGFMADWILTHTDRFACIVTHDGMFNPQSAYGTTEELWFNEWEFRHPANPAKTAGTKARAAAGDDGPGQPWRYAAGPIADDPFRRWSPMLSIQNAKTPTLVIHSQRDYRLDVSEGLQLFTALQRLHVPSRMLYFPDEGHWVLKPKNSQLWYQEVGAWCDRWTKNDGSLAEIAAPTPAAGETRSVENSRRIETPPQPHTTTAPARPAAVPPVVPAAVAAAAPRPGRSVQESKPPVIAGAAFSIAISVPQSEIKTGEDVPVTIIMTNVSDHQVLLSHKPGHDNGEFSFDIQVKDEAGREVPDTPYGRETRSTGQRREQARTVDYLQPGGTTVQVIHLEKVISLSRPGRYTVEVSRKDSLIDVVVRSNMLILNMKR